MALSAERNTGRVGDSAIGVVLEFPVKDNVVIYKGAIVVLSAGYAKPGAAAASLIAVGVAEETVDNTGTGHADGKLNIRVRAGAYWVGNNAAGSDAVVAADVGSSCYIEDDANVCHTSTSKSAAGKVLAVDATKGVLVQIALY